jgi:hypothetical protein
MIRVTVEMVPHGNEKRAYVIGIGVIANDGTGNTRLGNYVYALNVIEGGATVKYQSGEIKGFRRLENSVWRLLYRCLNDIFSTRRRVDREQERTRHREVEKSCET